VRAEEFQATASSLEGAGRQASVEDADESVGDLAEGGVVADPAGSDCVVGAGAGRSVQCAAYNLPRAPAALTGTSLGKARTEPPEVLANPDRPHRIRHRPLLPVHRQQMGQDKLEALNELFATGP